MVPNPFTPRVLTVSWLTAGLSWPAVWLALAVSQGVGVAIQGGEWIGLALPWGQHPWGLVNQPHVGFAASRGALFGYWLLPLLTAASIGLLPTLLGSSERGWTGELALIQISLGGCVLGLGWAPGLGVADGPAAGLARFWAVPPWSLPLTAALFGAVAIHGPVTRLGGFLWQTPAGPTRTRRLLVTLLHVAVPALAWGLASTALGWQPSLRALAALVLVLGSSFAAAWAWVPRAPLRTRRLPGWGGLAILALTALAVIAAATTAGRAVNGHARALLWGQPSLTNNVRPGMAVTRLTPLRDPEERRGR